MNCTWQYIFFDDILYYDLEEIPRKLDAGLRASS